MPGAAGPERQVPLAVAIGGAKREAWASVGCSSACATKARGQKPDSGLVSRSDASWPRPRRNHPIHASWKRSAKKLRRPAPPHTWVKLPTALRVWSLARLLLSPALVWPLPVRRVHPVCTADSRELSQGSPRSAVRWLSISESLLGAPRLGAGRLRSSGGRLVDGIWDTLSRLYRRLNETRTQ